MENNLLSLDLRGNLSERITPMAIAALKETRLENEDLYEKCLDHLLRVLRAFDALTRNTF